MLTDLLEDKNIDQFRRRRLGGVVRSKGFMWIAGRDQLMGAWSSAGPMLSLDPEGANLVGCPFFSQSVCD